MGGYPPPPLTPELELIPALAGFADVVFLSFDAAPKGFGAAADMGGYPPLDPLLGGAFAVPDVPPKGVGAFVAIGGYAFDFSLD